MVHFKRKISNLRYYDDQNYLLGKAILWGDYPVTLYLNIEETKNFVIFKRSNQK